MPADAPTQLRNRPSAATLRLVGFAMAAGLAALIVLALVLRPATGDERPAAIAPILGALAAASILVGTAVGATADPGAPSYAGRWIVSLALREAGGLIGALLTLLGGDVAWALALGGAGIVSLVALRPRSPVG